ncbi:MAG: hypothetical protein ACM4AI_23950 [Acidobacteriota bacterium]
MRRTILAVVLTVSPAQAFAEQSERVIPRLEFGIGAGVVVPPHAGGDSAAQGRVGVGITHRFGVEAAIGVSNRQFVVGNRMDLLYTVQGRYALSPIPRRLAGSLTFGGTGVVQRYRRPEYQYRLPNGTEEVSPARSYVQSLPPIVPTAGVAVHYAVTRRIAVRADAQAVFCPYFDAVGTIVSAGVAIPIPSRRSR